MKIHRLDHIHIYAADPASSVRFYETCRTWRTQSQPFAD
jgi:predicted enzyme related to lactoylglutathione lyase